MVNEWSRPLCATSKNAPSQSITPASLALSLAGARARDGRAMLMGTAFSTMTALFMVHALATPTILHSGSNGMMPLAGGLSVPAGAVLLGLTALPALRRPTACARSSHCR